MRALILIGALTVLLQTTATSQWDLLEATAPNSTVQKMERSGDRLFALSSNLYVSEDRGITWQMIDSPFSPQRQHYNTRIDFTVAGNALIVVLEDVVMRTTDLGATWTNVTPHSFLGGTPMHEGETLYLQYRRVLYRSIDAGDTWQVLGLPAEPGGDIIIHQGLLYGFDINETGIIIVDPDQGETVLALPGANPRGYNFFFAEDTLFVATQYGLHYLRPEDSTWFLLCPPIPSPPFRALYRNGHAYAVTQYASEFYIWDTVSRTWQYYPIDAGIPPGWFNEYNISVLDDQYIYLTVQDMGVYRIDLFDVTGKMCTTGMNDGQIDVFGGTPDGLFALANGLYFSSDFGDTWEERVQDGTNSFIKNMRTSEHRVYTFNGNDTLFASDDAGISWNAIALPDTFSNSNSFTGMAQRNGALFVSSLRWGDAAGGIIRTTNNGAYWELLPTPRANCSWIKSFDEEFFAAFDSNLYRSKDDGAHWKLVYTYSGPARFSDFTIVGDVYYASDITTLYRSTDEGVTWEELVFPIPILTRLTLVPVENHLIAYTQVGIFLLSDEEVWEDITGNVRAAREGSLYRYKDYLFVSTYDHGSYRLRLDEIIVEVEKPVKPLTFDIVEAYPNPARSQATLSYTLTKPEEVVIEVFDVMGRMQRRYEPGRHAMGPHTQTLNFTGLPPGAYHVVLRSGEAHRSTVVVIP